MAINLKNVYNNIDIDVFITEIENRPAIWDMRSELYSKRLEKSKAWEEVCFKFIPDFDKKTTNEKNTAASQVQRKWKSLRDSYNRERSRQKKAKSGSEASGRKEYVYFQQLSFLSVLAKPKSEPQDVKRDHDLPSPATRISSRRKRKTMPNIEKTEPELLHNPNKRMTNTDENDSDRNFLMSLLPDFQRIHDDFKLDLKTEFLILVKKYKNFNQPQPLRYRPQNGYGRQSMKESPTPSTSQDYNRSTCIPTSTPSPEASISLSDGSSIIDDMFYDNL